MASFEKIKLCPGLFWLSNKSADLNMLCGSHADAVKFLIKRGLIKQIETSRGSYETGPCGILLNDLPMQQGEWCNLAEFPILQMFYRQGKLIPGHINNDGEKPFIIGLSHQVKSQLDYIYRGNYGLVSDQELRATGVSKSQCDTMMAIKKYFAFGKIHRPEDLIDAIVMDADGSEIHIKNQVFVRRKALNLFEFRYKEETIELDLNLRRDEFYQSPMTYTPVKLQEDYFGVIHSGEGDGWDVDRGCMSSILMFDGKFYLVDAPPNIRYTLQALGISISMVEGVFQTHAHDDHFAGLTSLFQAHKKPLFFAAPWVRSSVAKKLCALMGIEEDLLARFFQIRDLKVDAWNDIEGLMVKPEYSPHPIETNTFKFRVLWQGGYKSYHHLADISSLRVLKHLKSHKAISQEFFDQIVAGYLEPGDIKKIDIGGGFIHGEARDFEKDRSPRIILAHKAEPLTTQERQIGSSAHFGSVDVLIPSQSRYPTKKIEAFLSEYFADVPIKDFRSFLQCTVSTVPSGSIIMRRGMAKTIEGEEDALYLIISGVVEMLGSGQTASKELLAGTMIGDHHINCQDSTVFRAKSYVDLVKIPRLIYDDFITRHHLAKALVETAEVCAHLARSELFREIGISSHFYHLARSARILSFQKGQIIPPSDPPELLVLLRGRLHLGYLDSYEELVDPGGFCFEDQIMTGQNQAIAKANDDIKVLALPQKVIEGLPYILSQILETYKRRSQHKRPKRRSNLMRGAS